MKGLPLKKTPHASEQDRADIARRRARWKTHQGRLDPRRLVFLDETWAKTNMTRRHGRCARGVRLVAKVPHGRWRTLTFLAALRSRRPPGRQGAARPLAHADLSGGVAS